MEVTPGLAAEAPDLALGLRVVEAAVALLKEMTDSVNCNCC